MGRVRALFRLCELYPGICLTTEEKKNTVKLQSQDCRRVQTAAGRTENNNLLYQGNNEKSRLHDWWLISKKNSPFYILDLENPYLLIQNTNTCLMLRIQQQQQQQQ